MCGSSPNVSRMYHAIIQLYTMLVPEVVGRNTKHVNVHPFSGYDEGPQVIQVHKMSSEGRIFSLYGGEKEHVGAMWQSRYFRIGERKRDEGLKALIRFKTRQ